MEGAVEGGRSVGWIPGWSKLDNQPAVERSVNRAIEFARRAAEMAADRQWRRMKLAAKMRQYLQQEIAVEFRQWTADDRVDLQELGSVGARLNDNVIGLTHGKQHAVRLDRPGQMNLLALAIRERGLTKCGRRKRD